MLMLLKYGMRTSRNICAYPRADETSTSMQWQSAKELLEYKERQTHAKCHKRTYPMPDCVYRSSFCFAQDDVGTICSRSKCKRIGFILVVVAIIHVIAPSFDPNAQLGAGFPLFASTVVAFQTCTMGRFILIQYIVAALS